jgi:hypothetical protein
MAKTLLGLKAYLSLQVTDEQAVEDLARFVAVADVFKRFGCVLTTYIEEDFFAAASTEQEKCQLFRLLSNRQVPRQTTPIFTRGNLFAQTGGESKHTGARPQSSTRCISCRE